MSRVIADGLSARANQGIRDDLFLGTVSQSGGVPTGAIIERGSNSNGEYTKFADGTLICTKLIQVTTSVSDPNGSVFMSSNVVLGSPAATFVGEVQSMSIDATHGNGTAWFRRQLFPSSNDYGAIRFQAATAQGSSPCEVYIIAIGRWF